MQGNYRNSEEATESSKLCEYGFTEKYDDVETLFDYGNAFNKQADCLFPDFSGSLLAGYSDKEIGGDSALLEAICEQD
ncbi:MAG: hypothetical protein ACLU6Y_03710 [Ruminococcus sp.]